jgi:hypothetical protein
LLRFCTLNTRMCPDRFGILGTNRSVASVFYLKIFRNKKAVLFHQFFIFVEF